MTTTPPTTPPPAQGVRMAWSKVPGEIRQLVDDAAGSPVVATRETSGGFSPGPAVVAELEDGRSIFVKAAGPQPTPLSPHIHRREAEILRDMPAAMPVPALIATVDHEGWVALLIEALDGAPPHQPWRPDELRRVLDLVTDLARSGDPSPIPGLPAVGREKPADFDFNGWTRLAGEGDGEPSLEGVSAWARRHLARLVELETGWTDAVTGATLVHGDLRSDNIVLTADGAYAVDWPGAAVGPKWIDLAGMVPSIEMVGGPPCEEIFDDHPVVQGADHRAIDVFLAALAGYFVRSSLLPAPPGLPTLRPFQRAQGDVMLRWIAKRLGLA